MSLTEERGGEGEGVLVTDKDVMVGGEGGEGAG